MLGSNACPDSAMVAREREPLRRRRYHGGSVKMTKQRPRKWVAQWWESGTRRNKTLGLVSEVSRSQAETMLAAIVRPLNEGAGHGSTKPLHTLASFVENVYIPFKRGAGWGKTDS